MPISIKRISVTGLHDQIDLGLEFNESLNIIYGKNGRGKTTILHILANVLERDFSRFRFLQFRRIEIETHAGGFLEIFSEGHSAARIIRVAINGQLTTPLGDQSTQLTGAEELLVEELLGPRAVYLPAFRSILERVSDQYRYAQEPARQKEIEAIVQSERLISKTRVFPAYRTSFARRDEQSYATASKTLQCRQWFGPFVPVIRYPSLSDVTERLASELREAQFEMATVEQKVFSESFTRVFDAIAANDSQATSKSTVDLLKDVSSAVNKITSKTREGESEIYSKILSAVRKLRQGEEKKSHAATNRVLALYAELLQRRSDQQESLFSKIGAFEDSINKFLDGKRLAVDGFDRRLRHKEPAIFSGNERPLSLSSLSSGERQVLTMIFCATRLGEDRGIFLVDEPELSLHIDWQRDILSEVMRQAGDRQVIACTHSPEVGADHSSAIQIFEPEWTVGPLADPEFSVDDGLEVS